MPLTQLRRSGRELAELLAHLAPLSPVVVAIPRRGVVVGREISRALAAELDVVLAAKVFPDRAASRPIGAVALGGIRVVDEVAAAAQGLRPEDVTLAVEATERRLGERLPAIRGNVAMSELSDRVVILVDDAAITGLTMQVALGVVQQRRPERIVVALGMCSHDAAMRLDARNVDVFALERLETARAAARHDDQAIALCPPLSDEEVHAILLGGPSPVRAPHAGALELDGLTAHDR